MSSLCERCNAREPVMALVASRPRRLPVKGPYPERSALCHVCIVTEVRVVDGMGYVPMGVRLDE